MLSFWISEVQDVALMADMKLLFNVSVVHSMFVVSEMTELQPGSSDNSGFFVCLMLVYSAEPRTTT